MRIIEPPSPYGYTIFCDDIRREVDGKITLVGVYGPEMRIHATLPAVLSKLALSVTYSERTGESEEPLELRVYLPGDADDAPTWSAPVAADTRARFKDPDLAFNEAGEELRPTLNFQFAFSPLELKQEGYVKVRMIRGDAEIRLGTLRIRAQPRAAGPAS